MAAENYVTTPHRLEYPIAGDGWIFIGIALALAIVALVLGWEIVGVLLLAVALAVAGFFRNPERVVFPDPAALVSPADGRILQIEAVEDKEYLKGPARKISIFMSVFNVHVNRMPADVTVVKVVHFPGKFLVASLDKASTDNERTEILLQGRGERLLLVRQIAGLVARRIVCHARPGDVYRKGQPFGLIKFGSRVEVLVPPETKILVTAGQKVRAGETILGLLP